VTSRAFAGLFLCNMLASLIVSGDAIYCTRVAGNDQCGYVR